MGSQTIMQTEAIPPSLPELLLILGEDSCYGLVQDGLDFRVSNNQIAFLTAVVGLDPASISGSSGFIPIAKFLATAFRRQLLLAAELPT